MEHQNESEINEENIKEDDDISISEDRRRSTSSISSLSEIESAITDFSYEDSSQIDKHEHANDEEDDTIETQVGQESALESPPVQVMERATNSPGSGYRIPSYVFARDKPSNPEWSMCSNESLFSINTGNMSFTRDQFNWLLKSGELGTYTPGDIRKSGELPPPSPRHEPILLVDQNKDHDDQATALSTKQAHKSGEDIIAAHFKTTSPPPLPTTDTNAQQHDSVGMEKDDAIIEAENKISSTTSDHESPLSKCISRSDASGQSFAFPVLAEIGRDKSINSGHSHTQVEQQKNSDVDKETNESPPKEATETTSTYLSWFPSCFSCCSCCC